MTDPAQLLFLLNFTSPTFPTGAFAYSHGLEWVISQGRVTDAETLEAWISDLLTQGSGWNDCVIIAQCGPDNLQEMNALTLALAPSAERWKETTALGASFAAAARFFAPLAVPDNEDLAYPVAIAAAGLATRIPREHLLLAYLQNLAAALVSVAVRLVPVGQRAGLEVLARLLPTIAETAARAAASTLADLGSATLSADIASMRHEFQEPRIFRT